MVIYCAAYGAERLFILVLLISEGLGGVLQNRVNVSDQSIFGCKFSVYCILHECSLNVLYKVRSIDEWDKNGILLPKLFWPTMRKNCSSDRENFLRSLELFI